MPNALSLGLVVRRDLVSRLWSTCDLCDPGKLAACDVITEAVGSHTEKALYLSNEKPEIRDLIHSFQNTRRYANARQ